MELTTPFNADVVNSCERLVDDIEQAVEDLFDEGFKPLFEPVPSVAMDGHEICYLYHLHVGLIELVSTK